MRRLAIVLAVFALAVGVASVFGADRRVNSNSAPQAAPARPGCGETVLRDWFENGRIDRPYARECYERALRLLPKNVRVIGGTLEGDLQERLARAS
ncbi:MAG TPA: hypothetical protein VFL41_02500 [Gaiellaceae bacterium]|nr:hypothetical protein [Gaiellaceae bacterium]